MYKNKYKFDDMKRSEHMAVRSQVGWYLFTHQLYEFSGEDVVAYFEKMVPKNVGNLKIGKERYTVMLDDNGEILDDIVLMRFDDNRFWLSTLFGHTLERWYQEHIGNLDVHFRDITDAYSMYSVQGPRSLEMVNALVKEPVDDLAFFSFAWNAINGIPVLINRAGFSGEKIGYEIYFPNDRFEVKEDQDKIFEAVQSQFGGKQVTDFQVLAWTLPTEGGLLYMRDLAFKKPFEVGLDKGFNWDKEFVGKEALLKAKDEPYGEMLGFTLEEDDAFYIRSEHLGGPGEPVVFNGEVVGYVQKIVYSYVNETTNGYIFAYRKGILKPGDKVILHGKHEAVICAPKFI